MIKTAIVIGSSGLTGSMVLDFLIKDNKTDHVVLLNRRPSNFFHTKITEYVVDFSNPETYADKLVGNCVFCCIGTTIKKAGTKTAFRLVDYTIPVSLAAAAAKNFIPHFLLVSSIGANPNSSNFYLRTKGECEQAVVATGIQSISIFRPSMLLGHRKETRPGEIAGKIILFLFKFLLFGPFKKYRSIKAETLASAMVNISHHNIPGVNIFESDQIENLAINKK